MFERFDIDENNVFKVCVVATMSSGKSTFINAVIGDEIMPEKNEACTARTMAVVDIDRALDKKVHILRKNGDKEVIIIENRDVLERVNNDEDVVDFLVETDIQSISNTSKALMLVDTPGVNNSEDIRHAERTETFLSDLKQGVIIYLMNATQLAINDDSLLLQMVLERVQKSNGNLKIIFVINKIDALDLETESIADIVGIAKEYIGKHGMNSPIIYPLSAIAAKSLRMVLYQRKMTRRELRRLEDIYENYCPKDNNMMSFAVTDDMSEMKYEIGDKTVTAQDLRRAIDNTGITAIERKIESFMRNVESHYTPQIVIKSELSESQIQKYQNRLQQLAKLPSNVKYELYNKTERKIDGIAALFVQNTDLGNVSYNPVVSVDEIQERIKGSTDELVEGLEKSLKTVMSKFEQSMYYPVLDIDFLYFRPEKRTEMQITAKTLFSMFVDGRGWQSINYGLLYNIMEQQRDIIIYNIISAEKYKVTKATCEEVVAILDTKIPLRYQKIVGYKKRDNVQISDVESYLNEVKTNEERIFQENKRAEEQLLKTYKGVVFDSIEEKEKVIKREETIKEYCKNLDGVTCDELWSKRKSLENLPSLIFAEYNFILTAAFDMREKIEENQYALEIEQTSSLEQLEVVSKDIHTHNYSDSVVIFLQQKIDKKKTEEQKRILKTLILDMEKLSREELVNLNNKVRNTGFESVLIQEIICQIEEQIYLVEDRELRETVSNTESMSIEELESLAKIIETNGYRDELSKPYLDMIESRKEFLHIKKMDELCCNVGTADRKQLLEVKQNIDSEKCKAELKEKYYEIIEQRKEKIDYSDLCRLTESINELNEKELKKIVRKIENGNFSEKYIKKFLQKVRIAIDVSELRALDEVLIDINKKDKEQIIALDNKIKSLHYPKRITHVAEAIVKDRLDLLGVRELLELESNFNSLTLPKILSLRLEVDQRTVTQKSKELYLKKLDEREMAIAYELVSPYACYSKQLYDQTRINNTTIVLPIFSPEYEQQLKRYFENVGEKDLENIPFVILPECDDLTMSRKLITCKTSRGYVRFKIEDVRSFSVEKKLLYENLLLTLKNGNVVRLSLGIIKRNLQPLAGLLTNLALNANNHMILERYEPYKKNVDKIAIEEDNMEQRQLSLSTISDVLVQELDNIQCQMQSSVIKYARQSGWQDYLRKVYTNWDIQKGSEVVFGYDKTLFSSAKEGIVIDNMKVHIKDNVQNAIEIMVSDIYELNISDGKMKIILSSNEIYYTELRLLTPENEWNLSMALNNYIKGVQMLEGLAQAFEQGKPEISESVNVKCRICGAEMRVGAKFCSSCGTKIEEIWNKPAKAHVFCSNCGTKLEKGTKFCSNCGIKL